MDAWTLRCLARLHLDPTSHARRPVPAASLPVPRTRRSLVPPCGKPLSETRLDFEDPGRSRRPDRGVGRICRREKGPSTSRWRPSVPVCTREDGAARSAGPPPAVRYAPHVHGASLAAGGGRVNETGAPQGQFTPAEAEGLASSLPSPTGRGALHHSSVKRLGDAALLALLVDSVGWISQTRPLESGVQGPRLDAVQDETGSRCAMQSH